MHDKIVLLGKDKLNTIEVLISKALIDSYISHDEFVSVNIVLREYNEIKNSVQYIKKKKKKNFMAPFYGWGSTASRLEPLRGGSLLFTTKFPEVPGAHSIDLGRMKG